MHVAALRPEESPLKSTAYDSGFDARPLWTLMERNTFSILPGIET